MKRVVIDLDETISTKAETDDYSSAQPKTDVIEKLRYFRVLGYCICIFTARNMRSFHGNIGLINVHTLPTVISWLDQHAVPYDEVIVGKPWCGEAGFYVDDRAIRPGEFVTMSDNEIQELLKRG